MSQLFKIRLSFYPHGGLVAKLCMTLATPWTVARQAPLFVGFSRQEYWSGLPCPPSGDFPDPGIKPASLASLELTGGFFTTRATWEAITQQFPVICQLSSAFKKNLIQYFI